MTGQQRPWCFVCGAWAEMLGVACDYHWFVLTDASVAAVTAEVLKHHPRGGSVRRVTEQAWVTRAGVSTTREEWRIRREFEAIEDADGDPGEWVPFRDARLVTAPQVAATPRISPLGTAHVSPGVSAREEET